MAGLPGANDRYDIDRSRRALYDGMEREEIRLNYKRFLEEVIPASERLGLQLAVHAASPPHDIPGLPRAVSTAEDAAGARRAVESPANGLTPGSGSFGAPPDNDLPAMARRFGPKIHFAHLRNVRNEPDGSVEAAGRLDGDMVDLARALLGEEARRRAEGRADAAIPFRSDHGHDIGSDKGRRPFPGHPLIGRLQRLAEMRGVIRALTHG